MVSGSVEKQVDPEASVHTTYPEQQNIGSASSEKIVEDVIRDSKGASDQQAGLIRIEKYGIEVQFHPSEILGVDEIQAVPEVPAELVDLLTEDQVIICVGIKASPSDAKFKYPVKVTMPHSAIFTSPDTASIGIYYRKSSSDSFSLISAANGDPRCDVRERDLDLYISHFSDWWIVVLFKKEFVGKRVICTPFIPKPSPKNTEHLLRLCIRDSNSGKPNPAPGYATPIKGEEYFVAWRSGDLKVTCLVDDKEIGTETIRETLFRYLSEVNVPFVVNTSAADQSKVLVRFTLEQCTKKTMTCVMNLSGDEETPRANRAQKSFHDEIDTSITDEELLDKAGNVPFADYHSLDDMDIDEGNNNQLTSIIHGYDESFGGLSAPPEILARGPRAQRVYAEAAKAGKKKVFRTRLMLVGQERVGKTSLKKTLTRQGFDKNEAITDGVETTDTCEISIEVAKAGGKKWSIHKKGHENKDQKEDEYKTALADEIAKRLTVTPPQNHERKPHSREDEMAKKLAVAPQQDQERLEPNSNTALGSGLNPVEAEQNFFDNVEVPKAKEESDNMPNQIAILVEKMLKEQVRLKQIGTDRTDSGRGEGVSLSIWDFAGHDIYYSTHQVFLTWRAIYVIVFDLSKSLGYVVPPESGDKKSKEVKGGAKSELTWLEFINFWLYSIYAHAVAPSSVINKNTQSKTAQKSPPIFIVGTHRESVKGDAQEKKEKIEKIHDKIRKSIMRRPFECHVVPRYYAIENSLEDKDEEDRSSSCMVMK